MPFLFTIPTATGLGFDLNPRAIAIFMLFGMFYTFRVICAVFESTVGGAVSYWYFSRNPYAREGTFAISPCRCVSQSEHVGGVDRAVRLIAWLSVGLSVVLLSLAQQMSPSLSALRFSLTKSFGSLALGSLVIAVFDVINLLLRVTEHRAQNRVVRFVIAAIRCVLSCLQSLAQAVNRFAFVYVGTPRRVLVVLWPWVYFCFSQGFELVCVCSRLYVRACVLCTCSDDRRELLRCRPPRVGSGDAQRTESVGAGPAVLAHHVCGATAGHVCGHSHHRYVRPAMVLP